MLHRLESKSKTTNVEVGSVEKLEEVSRHRKSSPPGWESDVGHFWSPPQMWTPRKLHLQELKQILNWDLSALQALVLVRESITQMAKLLNMIDLPQSSQCDDSPTIDISLPYDHIFKSWTYYKVWDEKSGALLAHHSKYNENNFPKLCSKVKIVPAGKNMMCWDFEGMQWDCIV